MKKNRRYTSGALIAAALSVIPLFGASPAAASNHVPNKPPTEVSDGAFVEEPGDKPQCGGGCAQAPTEARGNHSPNASAPAIAPSAASVSVPLSGARGVCRVPHTCWVQENNVNFRTGPGTNYPSLGQVHRGQGFDVTSWAGPWFKGNLWGGPRNVWIHGQYLDERRP